MVSALEIDVAVATKNNARTLEKCLNSIIDHLPVHHLVVVDGGSSDATLNIAQRCGSKIVHEPGLLGRVRLVQAQSCDTEWIAIIDSDIYVFEDWWPKLSPHMVDDNVGMIVGFTAPHIDDQSGTPYGRYLTYLNDKFGSIAFSNALVRRDLLLACTELLAGVHAGEDEVFAAFLKRNHLTVENVREPLCYHDTRTTSRHVDAYYRWGRSVRVRYGAAGFLRVFLSLWSFVRNWMGFNNSSPNSSNLRVIPQLVRLWICAMAGFLT